LRVFAEGEGEYLRVSPDDFRQYAGQKNRAMVPKLMSAQEAVRQFVADGDYIVWECEYLQRGPSALMREIIRQGKRELWAGAKWSALAMSLLVAGGCCNRIDTGFFMSGPDMTRATLEGRVRIYEYSNVVMTARLRAGAMGVPFAIVRSLGGTDNFQRSGAKIIEDPYTKKPVVIVPALNPDVALIHVYQADQYGNARIFGVGIADAESALASRKVILSAEEIIDTEEIRRNPGLTKIPYYLVDAVVHLPFGAYPGECAGYYASDSEHVIEVVSSIFADQLDKYLEKWVYSVSSEEEMLKERVGVVKIMDMQRRATIKEGYHP